MTRLKERLDRRIARMSSTEKIDREMAIILVAALAGGMAAASVILAVLGYLLTCGGGSPSRGRALSGCRHRPLASGHVRGPGCALHLGLVVASAGRLRLCPPLPVEGEPP